MLIPTAISSFAENTCSYVEKTISALMDGFQQENEIIVISSNTSSKGICTTITGDNNRILARFYTTPKGVFLNLYED